jgi:hypothetical protein
VSSGAIYAGEMAANGERAVWDEDTAAGLDFEADRRWRVVDGGRFARPQGSAELLKWSTGS